MARIIAALQPPVRIADQRLTLLADLVDTSHRPASSARRAKIAHIAELAPPMPADVKIGVSYLAGVIRQERSRIGYARSVMPVLRKMRQRLR